MTSGQEIVTSPTNTAAKVSSQAFFNCTVNLHGDDHIIWGYISKKLFLVRIYTSNGDGDGVETELRDKFAIDRGDHANGAHNLVVKNVQMDLGVRYYCGLARKGNEKYAELIALGMLCAEFMQFNCYIIKQKRVTEFLQIFC